MTKRMTAEEVAVKINSIGTMHCDDPECLACPLNRDDGISIILADRKATLEAAAERMRRWYNKQVFIFSKDTFDALFAAILRDEED
jgi:hypothetical protein